MEGSTPLWVDLKYGSFETFPRTSREPLAILNFRLASYNPDRLPSVVVYHELSQYLNSNVILFDIPFDFTEGIDGFIEQMDELVSKLHGEYSAYVFRSVV